MLCTIFLVLLTSVLYVVDSQQGQNFFFPATDNRQQARYIPFQQNQFPTAQQSFSNYFPQTNAGPFLPFRSPGFQLGDSNSLSSSQKFQNQQPFSVPPFQLTPQTSDATDPRFDPLISSPGVFGASNEDYPETAFAETPPEVPSQRFNSHDNGRQPSQSQYRNNQLARFSPVAISEVTRTQDNPNSPNVLQTHSFNVHHTTRHPEQLPAAQNNRWRGHSTHPDDDNFGYRARNVPLQHFSSARPSNVDTITEEAFPKFGHNRFASKEHSFLVNTQHPEVLESPEAQPESDSTVPQYVAHDSYFPQAEKKKELTKQKNVNVGRGKTHSHIPPTTYSPSTVVDNRARITSPTTESTTNDVPITTIRPQGFPRNRGRNKYGRPATEGDKSVKNAKQGKTSGAVGKSLSTTDSEANVNFDVVTMSQDHLFVSEDNFKGFVDSASIDSTESLVTEDLKEALDGATMATVPVSHAPVKKKMLLPAAPKSDEERGTKDTSETTTERSRKSSITRATETPTTSTEGWIIVASVQTSRSVSGARFIPSAAIKQEQHPLPSDVKSLKDIKSQIGNKSSDTAPSESVSAPKTTGAKANTTLKSSSTLSTESIIDKLDQVQSDLSSGILNAFPLQEKHSGNAAGTSPSTRSTDATSTTESDEVEEPPRRKFVPSSKTTPKPKVDRNKSLFDSVQFDDLTGLLPEGFKVRGAFSPKNPHTTAKATRSPETSGAATTATTPTTAASTTEKTNRKDKTKSNSLVGLKYKIKFDDVSAFLPPGYKPPPQEPSSSEKNDAPSGQTESTTVKVPEILSRAKPVDVSAFLPPGFHLNASTERSSAASKLPSILAKIPFKEADNLLPPDYTTEAAKNVTAAESTTKTESHNSSKVVFPSRPGSGAKKLPTSAQKSPTSVKSSTGLLPHQIPVIHKGWPIRATTEFAGWPSPSPSPISIEKLLQMAKEASNKESSSEAETSTPSTTTTTMTTTTTKKSTTPGICSHDCDLFGSIKLVGGVKWVPELLDHNTKEWRSLANDVQHQLEAIFQSSEALSRWYRRITIDAFSPGSVIVDYFVELSDLGRTVNTADMKRLFHETLIQEMVTSETFVTSNGSDYRQLSLGKFVIDPMYTDFVVLPRSVMPAVRMAEQDMWLPQWAIAVIVIGLASLLFVLIFGITVVISRHKNSKKHPTALTEEMLNELNKSHMGGFENYGADDLYNMEDVWNEKPFKKRSSYYQDGSMPNIYDSWRSDWNGYYGNSYYNGSIRSGYSRRRSDYDTNF